jgi:hypothetical protein
LYRFLVGGAGLLAFDDDFDMRANLRKGVRPKAENKRHENPDTNDAARLGLAGNFNSQI